MGKVHPPLLDDARRGKEDTFLRIFEEHHLPIFRFAWRLTGSISDAEDIVQDCFLALLRHDCGFDPARTALRTYLFGAVRNQWLRRLRHRDQGDAPERPDHRTPEKLTLQSEVASAVMAAIAELPDTQHEILLLSHYEQLTLAEIAEITQLEITAVKSRLQRARAALRGTLATFAPERSEV
jgi:RNA polymerase sigma-70 factor (ECF subfamily)